VSIVWQDDVALSVIIRDVACAGVSRLFPVVESRIGAVGGKSHRRRGETPPRWDRVLRQRVDNCYKKRFALWEKQTRLFYQKVPSIRYGDLFGLRAIRSTVKNFNEGIERIQLYNVWMDK
jgi:hypothetical protein